MRQLSLFKGKRQRGVRPKPPLEFHSHCVLADTIRLSLHPNWKATHLPMGEHRSWSTANRLRRMGVTAGWPDFVFVGPARSVFWLELKRTRGGRLSEAQADMAAHLVACGFTYLCTNSIDDAIATLKDAGILRGNIQHASAG